MIRCIYHKKGAKRFEGSRDTMRNILHFESADKSNQRVISKVASSGVGGDSIFRLFLYGGSVVGESVRDAAKRIHSV